MNATLGQLAAAAGARLAGDPQTTITTIVTDSRRVTPGCLFVALRGENFDGAQFVPAAVAAGAAAVVVASPVEATPACAVLTVDDALKAFGAIAGWWRAQFPTLRMVGITGSVGKTSTKELTWQVMSQRFVTLKSTGNHNNEVGVPTTLLELTAEHQAAVTELAMRGFGQIDYLAAMTAPQVGVITNIGHSHIGLLGSQQNIARAKGELLKRLPPDGVAVLNGDDALLPEIADWHAGRTIWYGVDGSREVSAAQVELAGLSGVKFALGVDGRSAEVCAPFSGTHMVQNALAAAGVGYALGLSLEQIVAGLEQTPDLKQRGEVATLPNGARVINDAYNAAPESVEAALAVMASEPTGGRRIAVLGGIAELGDRATEEHHRLGRSVGRRVDVLVGVGEGGQELVDGAAATDAQTVVVPDAIAAGEWLAKNLNAGDLALLKGSRVYALERALEGLR